MISEEQFLEHLRHFVETSDRIKDGWFLDSIRSQTFARKRCVVTVPRHRQRHHSNSEKDAADDSHSSTSDSDSSKCGDKGGHQYQPVSQSHPECRGLEEDDLWEDDDMTCMPLPGHGQTTTAGPAQTTAGPAPTLPSLQHEYHIVYSQSYAVPVLYFNVLNMAGQRLGLDEVWASCPDSFQAHLQDNKWTTLTQQEHPLLGIPFLMLHPCHTADLLAQVNKGATTEETSARNYLVTWLSAVGPLVGLKISEKYAMPSTR